MILQLNPVIALETPQGRGDAIFFEDDGHEMYWTVILAESRAIVQFKNNQVHACRCYTSGRGISDEDMRKIIAPKNSA